MGKEEVRYKRSEEEEPNVDESKGGVSDAEVESIMKLLVTYQRARAEGIAPPNPELDALLEAMQRGLPKDYPAKDEGIKLPMGATPPTPAATSDEVTPKPFFVVKTKNETKQKVFINVCGSHKIGAPDYGEDPPTTIDQIKEKIKNLNLQGDSGAPDVRFPCSCLDPTTSVDKKGNLCMAYDVCYNRTVVEVAMTVKSLKLFLIDMAIQWLGQKYKTQLNSDFKLPNAKYKGREVRKHCIRVDPKKGPMISELPDNDDDDEDSEPAFPLLVRDKHGRTLDDDGPQQKKPAPHEEFDILPEIPEWNPNFHDDATRNEVASNTVSKPRDEFHKDETSTSNQPWLPSGMFCELNEPSLPAPELEPEPGRTHQPFASAPSKEGVKAPPQVSKVPEFSFKKPEKKVKIKECLGKGDDEENANKDSRKPTFQVKYVGRPVTATTITVTFHLDQVAWEDIKVHATNSQIFIDGKSYDSLQVELQFLVLPEEVQATFSRSAGILTLVLPIIPYVDFHTGKGTKNFCQRKASNWNEKVNTSCPKCIGVLKKMC